MRTIWKYPIPLLDRFTLGLPTGFALLHVQTQGAMPMLWAQVDTEQPLETVLFALVGTGKPLPHPTEGKFGYVGSFTLDDSALVFHTFYRLTPGDDHPIMRLLLAPVQKKS